VFPFIFADESSKKSMELAQKHFVQYRLSYEYDEESFHRRYSTNRAEIQEVTRLELLNRKHPLLAKNGGIYCIVHENGQTVYIGLADRFYRRFSTGFGKHTDPCEDCKNHWGHFANPTRGARDVGMPDGDCRYFVLEVIPHKGNSIKQAEIDWYYIFRANGWGNSKSTEGKKVTNSIGMLGAKGGDSRPLYSVRLEDEAMFFFPSSIECEEEFPELKGKVREVLNGHQCSNRGFTHRWASSEEIEAMDEEPDRDALSAVSVDSDVTWLNSNGKQISVSEANQNSKIVWVSGRLTREDVLQLRSMRRGPYDTSKKSQYKRVYWQRRYSGWKWSAYKNEFKVGSKKRQERESLIIILLIGPQRLIERIGLSGIN